MSLRAEMNEAYSDVVLHCFDQKLRNDEYAETVESMSKWKSLVVFLCVTYNQFWCTGGLSERSSFGCCVVAGSPLNSVDTGGRCSPRKPPDIETYCREPTVNRSSNNREQQLLQQMKQSGYIPRVVSSSATSQQSVPSTVIDNSYDANKYS